MKTKCGGGLEAMISKVIPHRLPLHPAAVLMPTAV